jgi:hypothetical protein
LTISFNEDIYIYEPFYSERSKIIPADLVKILQDALYDPSTETTIVASDETIPDISKFLLAKHRLPDLPASAKDGLHKKHDGDCKDFHGFWTYPPDVLYNKVAVDSLLGQM